MNNSSTHRPSNAEAAQSELIGRVVREVIARLRAGTASGHDTDSPTRVTDRVVTAATITALPSSTRQIEVSSAAVVTPSARDEARSRGITVTRGWDAPANSTKGATSAVAAANGVASTAPIPADRVSAGTATTQAGLRDRERPERAEAVRVQLERRGVTFGHHTTIVLSDHPAAATHEEAAGGRRVATVRRLSDVDRFDAELGPECWVLDMIDLNPVAAVNAARRILQIERQPRSAPMNSMSPR